MINFIIKMNLVAILIIKTSFERYLFKLGILGKCYAWSGGVGREKALMF